MAPNGNDRLAGGRNQSDYLEPEHVAEIVPAQERRSCLIETPLAAYWHRRRRELLARRQSITQSKRRRLRRAAP